jgi:hypothetical protein
MISIEYQMKSVDWMRDVGLGVVGASVEVVVQALEVNRSRRTFKFEFI